MPESKLPVVVSGMRPTGRLHLGHLHGALANWVRLQSEARCFFFSADWHALTTNYHDTAAVKPAEREMFVDFIAAGIDPEKSTLFVQSEVKEHAELFLLLGMITPLGWLERSPSYKEMRENITDRDLALYGFLGYPVLQTADVVMYKATAVPVGADQVAHLELAREIVRKFNFHDAETVKWVDVNCRTAGIGCVDCKRKLLEKLAPDQERLRERREALLARPKDLDDLVQVGIARAREVAARTMDEVRTAMKL